MINFLLKPFADKLPENNRLERIWKLAQVGFKKRYYNDGLGLFWALLNPLFKIAIYFVIFSFVLKRTEDNFVVFLFAGLLIYSPFVEISKRGMNEMKAKKYLIENIRFDKVDLFISMTMSVGIGLVFNLIIYFLFVLGAGISITWSILFMPVIILNLLVIGMGAALILATIKIYLNDISHLWDMISMLGFWTSGIFFSGEKILQHMPQLYIFHPFIGLIENTRRISMYGMMPDFKFMIANLLFGVLILVAGIAIFRRSSHLVLEKF